MMLKTILVPLDGSPLAERALPIAQRLAADRNSRVLLMRAALAHAFPGTDPAERQAHVIDEAEDYLEVVAARLSAAGLTVATAVPYGPAADAILDEVRINKPDLIVMATHGRSGLGRWLYGSVTEAVLARSPVPVLTVRAWQDQPPISQPFQARRLVVPLDGSPFAEAALPVARDLAAALGAELLLLQAVMVPVDLGEPGYGRSVAALEHDLGDRAAAAREYLATVRARLAAEQPSCQVGIEVRYGAPVEAIASAAGAGLVVMATHGRTGLARMFLGSVAAAVLREGVTPLLLVRPARLPLAQPLPTAPAEAKAGPDVTLTLTATEIELVRMALETLSQTVTRHEHLHGRIHRLMAKLPTGDAGGAQRPEPVAAAR